ncbi:MAG: hypothetical protein KDN19_01770 [Verrucomicrobiae bacterium]|nr:hypothetical protein [Verrucomicrobiae bacterium]
MTEPFHPRFRSIRLSLIAFATLALLGPVASPVFGQADYKRFFDEENVPAVRELFQAGRYDICLQVCRMADQRGQPAVDWRVIKFQSLAATGEIEEALEEAEKLPISYPDNIPALMAAHDLFAAYGKKEKASEMLKLVNEAALKLKREERGGMTKVALGRAALALGADPAKVMEQYFAPVAAQKPKTKDDIPSGLVDAHIASGQLALDKSDYQRAANEFNAALKFAPNDPEIRYGLSEAYAPSDGESARKHLERALETNPVHAPSLLRQAETLINAEEYDAANERIDLVLSVNSHHPLAWAYRAVVDNLARADEAAFEESRKKALAYWAENPEVDHTIGRVLSRNYRFQEGAARQRSALEMDPDFLPARLQLAHDLLRIGDEDAAFALAQEVSEADEYNVLAYNLTVLRDELASYETVSSPDFTIRMPANEAEIYGDRAMELLTEAKKVLCEKYGLELDHPVLVEFFPHQQDFAIRTFGNLGGAGILGACFGTVVTMNSPGGLAHARNNWEATLWHEFCHVVTLTVTHNKMPRWLSEGISVYEEVQRDPKWGQRMEQDPRRMILDEDALTPISDLSGAFLHPESSEHLMFGYFQSMLVVKYLIDHYGLDQFQKILKDLGDGVLINDAIARNTEDIEALEKKFRAHVVSLAENLAPGVDWTQPPPEVVDPLDPDAIAQYAEQRPNSLWAWHRLTQHFLAQEKWTEAVNAADNFIALYPDNTHNGGGYALKAQAQRALGDSEGETKTLRELADRSAEAYTAYTRLLDLDMESGNWDGLLQTAHQAEAINPFLKHAHYCRGCALEAKNERKSAVESFEKLLILKPVNPSEIRFRLARLLKPDDESRAKRYLLDALVDAPRYREAHQLLLAFEEPAETGAGTASAKPGTGDVERTKKGDDPFGGGGAVATPESKQGKQSNP